MNDPADITASPLANPVIIGAGPVGRAIAEQLVATGQLPTLIIRSGSAIDGMVAVAADMSDRSAGPAALDGAGIVFQCAQPAHYRWVEEFRRFQTTVLDACAAAGAALIASENTYGYGQFDR